MSAAELKLRVQSITYQAQGINTFELVDPQGGALPHFTAGAHIDVLLENGLIRQYSLANDPRETHRYIIGVLHEPEGRGGSAAMHATVRVGQLLKISPPRNHFPLADDAKFHLLLAGGIGVTPMMAMMQELRAKGASYQLHYCARSPETTAFYDELCEQRNTRNVIVHHDGGDYTQGLDIAALLKDCAPGTHLYYCGPGGFMAAAEKAARHWPLGTVHCEYFTAGDDVAATATDAAFQVKIASSGDVYDIPPDQSIVKVLKDHGIDVPTSCESGLCGTCLTPFLEGEPEHRDLLLNAEEHQEFVLICCARSKTPVLVLDL